MDLSFLDDVNSHFNLAAAAPAREEDPALVLDQDEASFGPQLFFDHPLEVSQSLWDIDFISYLVAHSSSEKECGTVESKPRTPR